MVVWYSNLFQNFPQLVVIHAVKGFSIVNEAEVDVFLEFPCFFYDPVDVSNLISDSSAFLNPAYTWKFSVLIPLKPILRIIQTLCHKDIFYNLMEKIIQEKQFKDKFSYPVSILKNIQLKKKSFLMQFLKKCVFL